MLKEYNSFLNNDLLNEGVTTSAEIKKSMSNIVNNATKSLKNIKYKYYNEYTNDKQEIEDKGIYYAVVRFEPSVLSEETKAIENFIFWVKVQILSKSTKEIVDINKIPITICQYKIVGYDDAMSQYFDLLNKNISDIKLFKNKKDFFASKINEILGDRDINGFYLFKSKQNITTTISDKLRIDKSGYKGEIISEKGSEKLTGVRSKKQQLGLYKNSLGNVILVLNYKDDDVNYLNLSDNKLGVIQHDEMTQKFRAIKDKENKILSLSPYIESKLSENDSQPDLTKKINTLKFYIETVRIANDNIQDELLKKSLKVLLQNIFIKYDDLIKNIVLNKTSDIKSNKILKQATADIINYIRIFNSDKIIVNMLTELNKVLS